MAKKLHSRFLLAGRIRSGRALSNAHLKLVCGSIFVIALIVDWRVAVCMALGSFVAAWYAMGVTHPADNAVNKLGERRWLQWSIGIWLVCLLVALGAK